MIGKEYLINGNYIEAIEIFKNCLSLEESNKSIEKLKTLSLLFEAYNYLDEI